MAKKKIIPKKMVPKQKAARGKRPPKGVVPPQLKGHAFSKDNQPENRGGKRPGKTLMTRVSELLTERSRFPDGKYNTRFDDVANAFVTKMEEGSFIHTKEYIDSEQGKVPNRMANADGTNIKTYVGMPLEGEGAP